MNKSSKYTFESTKNSKVYIQLLERKNMYICLLFREMTDDLLIETMKSREKNECFLQQKNIIADLGKNKGFFMQTETKLIHHHWNHVK